MATQKLKIENLTYIIKSSKLSDLISKMVDLTRINDEIRLTFKSDILLIYSSAGINNNIHAFKSYTFKTSELFEKANTLENDIIFVLKDAKKVSQVLRFYSKYEDNIEMKLYFNDNYICERMSFKNNKLRDDVAGNPRNKTEVDITQIEDAMNVEKALFSFTIKKEDFDILKAKSTLEKTNDIYYLTIKDKKLYLGENNSTILIDDIDSADNTLSFPKKYFNTLNFEKEESIKIWAFDTFVLALSETTNLLITIEITI